MRRFVTLNCFLDYTDNEPFSIDFTNLRQVNFVSAVYKPGILQALRRANFRYHRSCSYSSLIRECNVGESETLLMFWSGHSSDSKITMSISASSCSSVHLSSGGQCKRARELLSTAQQTDISCRSPGVASPVYLTETEEHRLIRARVVDSFSFSSPASSLLQPAERSMSILSSVCALLLNKQGSAAVKAVSSVSGSTRSDNICRICFGGESAERLVRPCSCRGTIASVHRSCLERWLLQAATSYCELCRHHYVVTRSHKWSWARSVWAWARSGRGRALAADAWRALALGAASVAGTARALHACDAALQAGARRGGSAALAANLFSSLLIGIIGALNGLLTTWMLLKIQEHQASWRTWRDSTLHVHVTLEGEEEETVAEGEGRGQAESRVSTQPSDATIVGATADRSTNVADPFMTALPFRLPEL